MADAPNGSPPNGSPPSAGAPPDGNGAGRHANNSLPGHYRSLLFNQVMGRAQLMKSWLDPRRSVEDECGLPALGAQITPRQFQDLYDRDAIAARVVEVLPRESWQVQPRVYEDEDPDKETPFEAAWKSVGNALRGEESYFSPGGDRGSPVNELLRRADELSRVGHYGVILLGLEGDGESLADPAYAPGKKPRARRRLLYARVLTEALAPVDAWEADPKNPRYGQPLTYSVTLNDPRSGPAQGAGLNSQTVKVHWTRVVHLAEDLKTSAVFAPPPLQAVWDDVVSLRKVRLGSPEMFWKGAFPGISFESLPSFGGDVKYDPEKMRDMVENYMNGLQRYVALTGFQAKPLSPQVADPTPNLTAGLEAVCIKLGVPVRIFKGSERGELASSQDDGAWNDRLRARQNDYLTPRLIAPFVDRLINLGVLPAPADGYKVYWPDLESQTDGEKAQVASTRTGTLATYVREGLSSLVPEREFLTLIQGHTDEEADAILEAAASRAEEDIADEPASALTETAAGLTQLIQLYVQAKAGTVTEEQFKAVLTTFYGFTQDQADALWADGAIEPSPDPYAADFGVGGEYGGDFGGGDSGGAATTDAGDPFNTGTAGGGAGAGLPVDIFAPSNNLLVSPLDPRAGSYERGRHPDGPLLLNVLPSGLGLVVDGPAHLLGSVLRRLAPPPKIGAPPVANAEPYFAVCPRDKGGQCLPSGSVGAAGGEHLKGLSREWKSTSAISEDAGHGIGPLQVREKARQLLALERRGVVERQGRDPYKKDTYWRLTGKEVTTPAAAPPKPAAPPRPVAAPTEASPPAPTPKVTPPRPAPEAAPAGSHTFGGREEDWKTAEKSLGRSRHDLAAVAGAQPGATVTVTGLDVGRSPSVGVSITHDGYRAIRVVYKDRVTNESIVVFNKGAGLGTKVFSDQVAAAAARGYRQIKAYASRSEGGDNGYYTWPRLGYDATLASTSLSSARKAEAAARFGLPAEGAKLSDLMKTPGGRDFWKEHGRSEDLVFDLRPRSLSRKILDAYVAAKEKK